MMLSPPPFSTLMALGAAPKARSTLLAAKVESSACAMSRGRTRLAIEEIGVGMGHLKWVGNTND
jgi:hypothetical protein